MMTYYLMNITYIASLVCLGLFITAFSLFIVNEIKRWRELKWRESADAYLRYDADLRGVSVPRLS